MSELEVALVRAGVVAITLVAAADFELRTGDIPNIVSLAALIVGVVVGATTHTTALALAGMVALGGPAVWAYSRGALGGGGAKLGIGLGACLGLIGAVVTLALGAVGLMALARRGRAWGKLNRPVRRLASAPRIAIFAALGVVTNIAATFLPL